MSDATRNVVHVIAMYAAYIGGLAFVTELWMDLAPWRAKRAEKRRRKEVLASIARIKPLEPEILERLYSRSAYAHRRVGLTRRMVRP